MRLPAIAAAVLTLLWFPAATLAEPAGKTATGPKPKGFLTVAATLALGPIAGAPKPVSVRLVRMLDAESRHAGLALLNYAGAKGDYRLQGDLSTVKQGGTVKVVYSWEVLDQRGAVTGGTSGSIPVLSNAGDPWDEADDVVLKIIAGQGIDEVMRQIRPDKPGLAKAAVSVSSPAAGIAPRGIPSSAPQPALSDDKAGINADEALRLVNNYRKSRGLAPLRLDGSLSAAALALARDMAGHDRLSHTGPDDKDLRMRLKAAGYQYMLAAENVGTGQQSLAELFAQWELGPSQSRTMLLPEAREMGIAYQYRPDTKARTYWTLVVAAPL
jgi:uncharacterized protein YkwD